MERDRNEDIPETETPDLAQVDWDDLATPGLKPEEAPANGDLRYQDGPSGELPGEDDDNEYQESDEALPDEAEERAITRHPDREGGRFDEI